VDEMQISGCHSR